MTQQALLGQQWPNQSVLWAGLDARRAMLNQHIPYRDLQGRAPLEAYPEARHSGRSYHPEWEVDMLDRGRVFRYLAICRWFRHVKQNGVFALGGVSYHVSTAFRTRTIELTCDADREVFIGRPEGSDETLTIVPHGLTKVDLMGELIGGEGLVPAYQLALPFSQTVWRELQYAQGLTGTSL